MTGTTTCAVGERDGQVVLSFPDAVDFAAFDPETARNLAESIARTAYKAHTGIDGANGNKVITDVLRERMILNVSHMVRSLIQQKRKNGYIAMAVVDYILGEVS